MGSAISIRDLGVTLGGRQILKGVNAEIEEGEFIGIFGPNGAGKSTLIRCLFGLIPLSSGSITILGQPPRTARRAIGYMPQSRFHLEGTALDGRSAVLAASAGWKWGLPWKNSAERASVERAMELAGAAAYANRPFSVLSGGERQRIGLAQALLDSPRVLVLDEPLASLDPKNQALLVERVQAISRETKATVLFIAHDMNPLLNVMDRVLYVAGGTASIGPADEVVTSEHLSRLYGSEIQVLRLEGRIFILTAEGNVTEAARHD